MIVNTNVPPILSKKAMRFDINVSSAISRKQDEFELFSVQKS